MLNTRRKLPRRRSPAQIPHLKYKTQTSLLRQAANPPRYPRLFRSCIIIPLDRDSFRVRFYFLETRIKAVAGRRRRPFPVRRISVSVELRKIGRNICSVAAVESERQQARGRSRPSFRIRINVKEKCHGWRAASGGAATGWLDFLD